MVAIALMGFAIVTGDWADFWAQFHTHAFVHLITLGFLSNGSYFSANVAA